MKKNFFFFAVLAAGLAGFSSPAGAGRMTTVYSSTQTASFSSSNFGMSRIVKGLTPDSGYSLYRTINFDTTPPTSHEVLTYISTHPYWAYYGRIRVRSWDDPRLPFEFQNDKYIKEWLALGYFFKPGERAYLYPPYAR